MSLAWIGLLAITLPALSLADPTSPIVSSVPSDEAGEMFFPLIRGIPEVETEYGYVIEEFLIAGAGTVYTYEDPPVRGEIIPLEEDVPYQTRILLLRPELAENFSGTVVIEWLNSSAGFDSAPVWDPGALYFAREGIVYIGVTNAQNAVEFLADGCKVGPFPLADCGTRYETLSLPENGLAYEMVSQIANALKTGPSSGSPLPEAFEVDRVFHSGQSQQGGSIATYASAFHFAANDGYFMMAASSARDINSGPVCGEEGSPDYPGCTPRLEGDDRRIRTDLPVPVYRAMTGTDLPRAIEGGTRQTDTATFRYYELPGTAHVTVHEDIEPVPGVRLEDWCANELNTLVDGPVIGAYVYNALWKAMEAQSRDGTPPPDGLVVDTTEEGEISFDEFDNPLGGIRHPAVEAPVATYLPNNTGRDDLPPLFENLANLFCRLAGSVDRLSEPEIAQLYEDQSDYEDQIAEAIDGLLAEGFLLEEDADPLFEQLKGEFPVPEPAAALLQLTAVVALAGLRARRRSAGSQTCRVGCR